MKNLQFDDTIFQSCMYFVMQYNVLITKYLSMELSQGKYLGRETS